MAYYPYRGATQYGTGGTATSSEIFWDKTAQVNGTFVTGTYRNKVIYAAKNASITLTETTTNDAEFLASQLTIRMRAKGVDGLCEATGVIPYDISDFTQCKFLYKSWCDGIVAPEIINCLGIKISPQTGIDPGVVSYPDVTDTSEPSTYSEATWDVIPGYPASTSHNFTIELQSYPDHSTNYVYAEIMSVVFS